jgi:[amino group carrier protein]-L-2-aminoadipate/L-glutamate 6-kinase
MITVVKVGGTVLDEGMTESFITDIKRSLSQTRIVLVHGGGNKVTQTASKMGKEQQFLVSPDGFKSRYTDKDTMEIFTMVMAGKINKRIVSSFLEQGVQAVGITGIDGASVRASRKKQIIAVNETGRRRLVDDSYTGKIENVDPKLISLLLENGYTPVVAPIVISEEFEELNVDGDRMAAHIAGSLRAERLVLLTDVEGLVLNGSLVPRLTLQEAESTLPGIGKGMITKIHAAVEAVKMGVGQAVVMSGLQEDPISKSLSGKTGTVIVHG